MADQVLTKQKLINADEDLGDLEEVLNGPPGKLIKTRLGREVYTLASVPQINTMTREEVTAAVAPKANKVDVDTALSNLSTTANKFYPTLAEANYYITTMAVNDVVTIGEEANKGLWYKATAGATSLTKSPFDPVEIAKADATTKSNTAKTEAIAKAATLSSIGEWLTEDGKTTLSTLDMSITADANKLKVIRTIEKIALLNASSSERFYIQSVLRNQGVNGSRIHVQRESQLGTNNRVASLIIADTVTTAGVQEYTVDGTDGIKLKILVNWDNFETNTSALNVNLPINNLKFLKEFQAAEQIAVAKAEAISAAATDATSKANAAETNAKNYTDQFFNQFLINEGASWES